MEFTDIVTRYGLQAAVIAFASIFLVGCFKLVLKKPLSKIEKSNRKPIYETLSLVFTYGLIALWVYARVAWFKLDFAPFDWNLILTEGSAAYVAVKVIYPLYENYKVRDLLQLIGRGVIAIFKHKAKAKIEDTNNTSGPITL